MGESLVLVHQRLPLFWVMTEEFTFVDQKTLETYLWHNGWLLTNQVKQDKQYAILKADFYDKGVCIATSRRGGRIYCDGETIIKYNSNQYESVNDLLKDFPNAIQNYETWEFIQEKEWVLAKHHTNLLTFSNLSQWPKSSKYRC